MGKAVYAKLLEYRKECKLCPCPKDSLPKDAKNEYGKKDSRIKVAIYLAGKYPGKDTPKE